MLDMTRVTNNKISWQAFNIIFPVLLVLIFGFVRNYMRKRKYASGK
jgi:ABC-2 type transport system permease protein